MRAEHHLCFYDGTTYRVPSMTLGKGGYAEVYPLFRRDDTEVRASGRVAQASTLF
jgi:hypothetical protein